MVLTPCRAPGSYGLTIITSSKCFPTPSSSSFNAPAGHAVASAENIELRSGLIAGQHRGTLEEVDKGTRPSPLSTIGAVDESLQLAEPHQDLRHHPAAAAISHLAAGIMMEGLKQSHCRRSGWLC